MLGATFTAGPIRFLHPNVICPKYSRRFGQSPLYSPLMPSVRAILCRASSAPLFLYPSASSPRTCIFRRRTSKGYVSVCDIDPANAPHASLRCAPVFPGGVMMPRSASYAAKLIPDVDEVRSCEKARASPHAHLTYRHTAQHPSPSRPARDREL